MYVINELERDMDSQGHAQKSAMLTTDRQKSSFWDKSQKKTNSMSFDISFSDFFLNLFLQVRKTKCKKINKWDPIILKNFALQKPSAKWKATH